MTRTPNESPRTETGLLRCQEETAVASYRTLVLEQQAKILELESKLADVTSRAAGIGETALATLRELADVSLERSRYRAALWTVEKAGSLEEAKAVARGVVSK